MTSDLGEVRGQGQQMMMIVVIRIVFLFQTEGKFELWDFYDRCFQPSRQAPQDMVKSFSVARVIQIHH